MLSIKKGHPHILSRETHKIDLIHARPKYRSICKNLRVFFPSIFNHYLLIKIYKSYYKYIRRDYCTYLIGLYMFERNYNTIYIYCTLAYTRRQHILCPQGTVLHMVIHLAIIFPFDGSPTSWRLVFICSKWTEQDRAKRSLYERFYGTTGHTTHSSLIKMRSHVHLTERQVWKRDLALCPEEVETNYREYLAIAYQDPLHIVRHRLLQFSSSISFSMRSHTFLNRRHSTEK